MKYKDQISHCITDRSIYDPIDIVVGYMMGATDEFDNVIVGTGSAGTHSSVLLANS